MTWARGASVVDSLISQGRLALITGAAADGSALLASASGLLSSAEREAGTNPEAAFVLAYDSARKSCAALLAQQGLRTKSAGHHVTTEEVVRAQFGGPFDRFGYLRRRRAEIEYPQMPGDDVSSLEALEAISLAREIYSASQALLPEMTLFSGR